MPDTVAVHLHLPVLFRVFTVMMQQQLEALKESALQAARNKPKSIYRNPVVRTKEIAEAQANDDDLTELSLRNSLYFHRCVHRSALCLGLDVCWGDSKGMSPCGSADF